MRRSVAVVVGAMLPGVVLLLASWATGTEGPPKIFGIAYVTLKVTDLEASSRFYEAMGLPLSHVKSPGVEAAFLVNANQSVRLVKTAPGTTGSYLAAIALATDDLTKMHAYLKAKGVPAGKIVTVMEGGSSFETTDPEGNRIVFVEVKKWDPANGSGSPAAISRRLLHAGFVVKHWQAENRFYQDVLGFRLYWKGGFKDDGLDWYEIQVPDGDNWLEYMLNIPANADHKDLGVQNHFSLGVNNANSAAQYLRAHGITGFDGPEIGRDGKNSLDAYDPDFTRVEVMEFVPSGKICCGDYRGSHPRP